MVRIVYTVLVLIVLSPTLTAQEVSSTEVVGSAALHTVEAGDSLSAIGARYGVDWPVLARENGLNAPDGLAVGQVLRIDNRHIVPAAPLPTGIIINIPQRMLFYCSSSVFP